MTEAELNQISRGFRKMIEAIPKTRVREHIPTIDQISRLLEQSEERNVSNGARGGRTAREDAALKINTRQR